jgi:hypothetical protein
VGSRSDDTAADSSGGQEAVSPTFGRETSGKRGEPRHLTKDSVRSYAQDLAAARPEPTGGHVSRSDSDMFGRNCSAPQGIGGLKEPVVWYGDDALLVVRREPRVASVYSCDATPRLLYFAPY